jgi:DNA gyrase subunit B/topoisomerase-4 subunit B
MARRRGTVYGARSIKVLEGLDPVRKRPAMYIGGTDKRGMHHLLWEVVDNAIDEVINGHANHIQVKLHKDRITCTVKDNGRGIPTGPHPKVKKSALEVIMTTLHAGGKFSEDSYQYSGGLHGVGASVVNALSSHLEAVVTRDGKRWRQTYARGKPRTTVKRVAGSFRGSGTDITFTADEEVFGATRFDARVIRERLEAKTYLHRGLRITFRDEPAGKTHTFLHEGGLVEYCLRLMEDRDATPVHPEPFFAERQEEGADRYRCELAIAWTARQDGDLRTFANGIPTLSGGSHDVGLRGGIVKALRNYMAGHNLNPKGITVTADDIREGLYGILSIYLREPQFEGQTKDRLNNPATGPFVDSMVRLDLERWLNENPSSAEAIIGRIVTAARARQASREAASAVTRKGATQTRLNLPGKLSDCQLHDTAKTELFIVEGDSAGGSAKQGRDRRIQAILPLRGKVLNTEQASLKQVLSNREISDLVQALGTGIGGNFDLRKLRYGKVCLLMDADADGHHIATLLLTFFFRHLPELIRAGKVYLAQPPLYRIDVGRETHYALDEAERDEILEEIGDGQRVEIMRFKGLGEMSPKLLFETTLDPNRRTLLQVVVDNQVETHNTISELMGKDAAARYRFIMEGAEEADAEAIDI